MYNTMLTQSYCHHHRYADSEENEASDCMHILKALTSNAEQWKQVRTSESVKRWR